MPLQASDLLVVQRGGQNFKATGTDVKSFTTPPATAAVLGGVKVGRNLEVDPDGTLHSDIPEVLRYKGGADVRQPAPGAKSVGDVYIVTDTGVAQASWTGIAGQNLVEGEFLIWDGAKWAAFNYYAGGIQGVIEVLANAPLRVNKTDPEKPVISVDGGTTGGAGVVQLATNGDVAAGTPNRVVTADQLKATNDAINTATAGGLTNITGSAPIQVTGGGATRNIAIQNATASAFGVVQLADATDIANGNPFQVVDAAQLKAVNDRFGNYLLRDFNSYPALT